MKEEEKFLNQTWYFILQFDEGPVAFKVLSREIVDYRPYYVGVIQPGQSSDWISLRDPNPAYTNQFIIEPVNEDEIFHFAIGLSHPEVEAYLQYPANVNRISINHPPTVPGPYKWLDGSSSPFEDPDFDKELFTIKNIYPAFKFVNQGDTPVALKLRILLARYKYLIVKDRDMIERLITGRAPAKLWGFINPPRMPDWLRSMVGRDVLMFAKEVWESARR